MFVLQILDMLVFQELHLELGAEFSGRLYFILFLGCMLSVQEPPGLIPTPTPLQFTVT